MLTVNELAIRDQKEAKLSEELWEASKHISFKVMAKLNIEMEERVGLAAEAMCEALQQYDPDKGDFGLVVHYRSMAVGQNHWKRMKKKVQKDYI